jgi:mannose-6-phosphate isomerase-like protein (cupin superfamily)
MLSRRDDVSSYITKDGSTIRELIHPQHHGNLRQSLAEAIVAPDASTRLHRHHQTEEIYHVIAGHGVMTLGEMSIEIGVGDSVCIAPGTAHAVHNNGETDLVILCCCAPPYSHEDTELLESGITP